MNKSVWVRKRGVGKPWNCSKPGDSAEHMAPTKASDSCKRTLFLPPLPSPAPKPQTPSYLSLSFFRSVAHGAEKIVFITCQHLAALSYATQDSIKLSYTGMKLQNRPGTSQQNYLIFPPLPKIQRSMFAWDFFLTDREMLDLIWWRKKIAKGHFKETVLHTCFVIKKKEKKKRFWRSCDLCSG